MRTANKRARRQRGTQIAELAIVLPLLMFLALAVAEGAAMIRAHQVLNNASREAARLAVLPEFSPAAINPSNPQYVISCAGAPSHTLCQAVINYAQNNGVTTGTGLGQCNGSANSGGLNITITQNVPIGNASVTFTGSRVQVVCPYTLNFLPRVPSFGITPTVNLTGAVVFRNFYGS